MNDVFVGGSDISSDRLLPLAESDRRAPAKIRTDEEAAAKFGWLLVVGMELARGADVVIPDVGLTAGADTNVEENKDDKASEEDLRAVEFSRKELDVQIPVSVFCPLSPPLPIVVDALATFCD